MDDPLDVDAGQVNLRGVDVTGGCVGRPVVTRVAQSFGAVITRAPSVSARYWAPPK
ncbi:hypothetical protein [Streptomyces brasiliscabiei]|uniref:Uncharacterized protein n=1 Tax=Streptomyces brasiliscabiei TaxID=2736302 RepID=A0ABU8GD23_9ACTN